MPTYRVDELEGELLDRAAAMACGVQVEFSPAAGYWRIAGDPDGARWTPTQDGNQGVEIIERERIELISNCVQPAWMARRGSVGRFSGMGPTPLVAAMRALVLAKLGEEIEL